MRVEEFYATRYNKGMPILEDRIKKVRALFAGLRGDRLLDIGCGDGTLSVIFGRAMGAREVHGVDIASEAIQAAEKQGVKACQLNIDQADLPFEDGYFDGVYCGEIIEHLFDPDHLLDEVYRVLKPQGFCILSTPNLAGWPNRLALLLGCQPYPTSVSPRYEGTGKLLLRSPQGQWSHIRVFTLRALKELTAIHRFRIRRLVGSSATVQPPSPLSRLLLSPFLLFDRAMTRIPSLATRIVAELEKAQPPGDPR
jgi:methionine biosynthesis protein MetW